MHEHPKTSDIVSVRLKPQPVTIQEYPMLGPECMYFVNLSYFLPKLETTDSLAQCHWFLREHLTLNVQHTHVLLLVTRRLTFFHFCAGLQVNRYACKILL